MPFNRFFVTRDRIAAAQPLLNLDPRPTFGSRLIPGAERDSKVAVAICAGETQATSGGTALVTDGSSTFCLETVLIRRCLEGLRPKSGQPIMFTPLRKFHLLHNGLSMSSEMQLQNRYATNLTPELLGGLEDIELSAVFPRVYDEAVIRWLARAPLAFISVRELFFSEGPTSPDSPSREFKLNLLRLPIPPVILLDWRKMCGAKPPPKDQRVFADLNEWESLKRDREIVIICDKHPEVLGDSYEEGRQAYMGGIYRPQPGESIRGEWRNAWESAPAWKRYCWNVYAFSEISNITFIEVTIVDELPLEGLVDSIRSRKH